jgi:hypothetical protein
MDPKTLGEMIPPQHRSQAQDGFDASMLAQEKAKRIENIEARLAADDARRIRVLRAWGPLYYLAGRPQTAAGEAGHWRVWAARIIDTVAAFKAEDVVNRLDEIDTGEGDTSRSRAAKHAVLVYRLAIDGNAGPVAKAVADAIGDDGHSSRSGVSPEHVEEMLRWRIVASVFAAEWRRFTQTDLEHELERLAGGRAWPTAAGPTTELSPRFPRRVRRAGTRRR